jgi:hypothetical protein
MEKEDFNWDVFISYRRVSPDQEWVQRELVPKLEKAGLKVWLDVNDGRLGSNIPIEMPNQIQASKWAIPVISPAYVRATRKLGGRVASEWEYIRGLPKPHIPLILCGEIPPELKAVVSVNWTNPTTHPREWNKLLETLHAQKQEVPPPGAVKLYFIKLYFHLIKLCLRRALPAICIALLIVAAVVLAQRFIASRWLQVTARPSPEPAPSVATPLPSIVPSPVPSVEPPRDSPRLVIRKVNGIDAGPDVQAPPSAVVSGVVEGTVPADFRVFGYVRHVDHDDLWRCAGAAPLDGRAWSLGKVALRPPLPEGETKADIMVLLSNQEECEESPNSKQPAAQKESSGAPALLRVTVPRPVVTVGRAKLDQSRTFNASGEARNILEGQEDLSAFVTITRGGLEVTTRRFPITVLGRKWTVNERVADRVESGDQYVVEVGLTPKGYDGDFRPDVFFVLARKDGVVGAR